MSTAHETLKQIQQMIVAVKRDGIEPNTLFISPTAYQKISSLVTRDTNRPRLYGMDIITNDSGIFAVGYCATIRNNWLSNEPLFN